MRHLTDDGLALIKRFEGFASEIYVCPGGWPTIGYGHVVREGEHARFAGGIDEATAEDLLRRDVETAERAVLRLIRVPLDDGRFDALGSFTFNLGSGALQRSTLRRKVNREEHDAMPCEFRRWVWAADASSRGWCGGGRPRLNSMAARWLDHPKCRRRTVVPILSTIPSRPLLAGSQAGSPKSQNDDLALPLLGAGHCRWPLRSVWQRDSIRGGNQSSGITGATLDDVWPILTRAAGMSQRLRAPSSRSQALRSK